MKVTLINAQIREANNLVPPLGLLSLAAVLKQNDFAVQVLDADFFKEDLSSQVESFAPDIVGVSFLTPGYTRAKHIVKSLKSRLPGALFCSGGYHTSIFPERVLADFDVDFCVVGEGEATFLDVCRRIRSGTDYSDAAGICFKKNGQPVLSPPRPLIADLDELPVPATECVDFERYLAPPGLIRGKAMSRMTAIATSRGCPFRCAYCGGSRLYGGTVRLRSVPSVTNEIGHLVEKHRIKGIWIVDECFTINKERTERIADELARFGLVWGVQTRVDLIDRELIQYFKERGCAEINFGIESGVDRILRILKKGTGPERAIKVFDWCKEAGMRTTANFMLGTPSETEEDMYRTFALAKRLRASYTVFHMTTPFPGSELYEQAIAQGLMSEPRTFDETWMHRDSKGPIARTTVPPERLIELRVKFQNAFFFRNYVTVNNIYWGLYFLYKMIRYPAIMRTALRAYRQQGRLDSFIEKLVAGSYAYPRGKV